MDPPTLPTAENIVTAAMFHQLQARLNQLLVETTQLREKIDQLCQENAQLRGENAQLREKIDQLCQENAQLRGQNAQLREENTQLRLKIENMSEDISDNRRRIRDLEKDRNISRAKSNYNRALVKLVLDIF